MDLFSHRKATISNDGLYRYRLERDLGRNGKVAAFILVNPSTADGDTDDPTIRKLSGFSVRNGIGRFIVGNKFAFRATDIKALGRVGDPIGSQNDIYLSQIMRDADIHIVAWGPLGKLPTGLRERWKTIQGLSEQLGVKLYCFGTAKDGHPFHPLMLPYDTSLVPWICPL